MLPLAKDRLHTVLVAGPLADDHHAWNSRYAPQALDFVTTLIGLHLGAGEGSLFISWLMSATNPVAALTIAKGVGFAWGGYCLLRRKPGDCPSFRP